METMSRVRFMFINGIPFDGSASIILEGTEAVP